MASGRRPEHVLPPELQDARCYINTDFEYYDEKEAEKYTRNSRIIEIQSQLSERAVELLSLPPDQSCMILDIGCGSGLSGEALTEQGHRWVGIDISSAMLEIARQREVEGDLILADIGEGLPFRPASFDGAISISAVQWLCNADKSSHHPVRRIRCFFTTLYACLRRGARAVIQFYPENPDQLTLLQTESIRAGFSGNLLIDYPNSTKAKKYFLILDVGGSLPIPAPLSAGVGDVEERRARFEKTREVRRSGKGVKKGGRDWIKGKKEKARNNQKEVPRDSKFTGRRRNKPKF